MEWKGRSLTTKDDLKGALEELGLPTSGLKAVLEARLREAIRAKDQKLLPDAISKEELAKAVTPEQEETLYHLTNDALRELLAHMKLPVNGKKVDLIERIKLGRANEQRVTPKKTGPKSKKASQSNAPQPSVDGEQMVDVVVAESNASVGDVKANSNPPPSSDLAEMSFQALRAALREAGLPSGGTKAELLERLSSHRAGSASLAEASTPVPKKATKASKLTGAPVASILSSPTALSGAHYDEQAEEEKRHERMKRTRAKRVMATSNAKEAEPEPKPKRSRTSRKVEKGVGDKVAEGKEAEHKEVEAEHKEVEAEREEVPVGVETQEVSTEETKGRKKKSTTKATATATRTTSKRKTAIAEDEPGVEVQSRTTRRKAKGENAIALTDGTTVPAEKTELPRKASRTTARTAPKSKKAKLASEKDVNKDAQISEAEGDKQEGSSNAGIETDKAQLGDEASTKEDTVGAAATVQNATKVEVPDAALSKPVEPDAVLPEATRVEPPPEPESGHKATEASPESSSMMEVEHETAEAEAEREDAVQERKEEVTQVLSSQVAVTHLVPVADTPVESTPVINEGSVEPLRATPTDSNHVATDDIIAEPTIVSTVREVASDIMDIVEEQVEAGGKVEENAEETPLPDVATTNPISTSKGDVDDAESLKTGDQASTMVPAQVPAMLGQAEESFPPLGTIKEMTATTQTLTITEANEASKTTLVMSASTTVTMESSKEKSPADVEEPENLTAKGEETVVTQEPFESAIMEAPSVTRNDPDQAANYVSSSFLANQYSSSGVSFATAQDEVSSVLGDSFVAPKATRIAEKENLPVPEAVTKVQQILRRAQISPKPEIPSSRRGAAEPVFKSQQDVEVMSDDLRDAKLLDDLEKALMEATEGGITLAEFELLDAVLLSFTAPVHSRGPAASPQLPSPSPGRSMADLDASFMHVTQPTPIRGPGSTTTTMSSSVYLPTPILPVRSQSQNSTMRAPGTRPGQQRPPVPLFASPAPTAFRGSQQSQTQQLAIRSAYGGGSVSKRPGTSASAERLRNFLKEDQTVTARFSFSNPPRVLGVPPLVRQDIVSGVSKGVFRFDTT